MADSNSVITIGEIKKLLESIPDSTTVSSLMVKGTANIGALESVYINTATNGLTVHTLYPMESGVTNIGEDNAKFASLYAETVDADIVYGAVYN